jgi:hypothetical protein
MTKDQLDQALTRRWAEYQQLLKEGASYSAIVRLGEIANCLQPSSPPSIPVEKWQAILTEVHLTGEVLLAARTDAANQVNRLKRMLGVGGDFTYEELLLVIAVRVELDLFSQFLCARGIQPELNLRQVDTDIRELASATLNISAFHSAQSAARKNWGLPIRSRWLEGVGHSC